LKRVADVAFDQARSLRVRSYVNFLKNNPSAGMYLQIGSDPISCINRYTQACDSQRLKSEYNWLSTKEISAAVAYKTTLARMNVSDFDLITRHGYETALWNEEIFLQAKEGE